MMSVLRAEGLSGMRELALPANNSYGNAPVPIAIPDAWELEIQSYAGADAPAMTAAEIAAAVAAPEGIPPIREGARGKGDAVIIFDDFSRPTPVKDLIWPVIAELEAAGIPGKKIRLVAATGAHRAMSRMEFAAKLGEDVVNQFRIYNHNPFFNNVLLGFTDDGMPIELNAECVSAGYKIGIGSIFPHSATGVGGGAKIVLPGVASIETIRRFHLSPSQRWNTGLDARKATLRAAELLGLDCKIDALLNGAGELARLFVGHYRLNVDRHLAEIRTFFRTVPPAPADLVIANNYFKPSEAVAGIGYPEFRRFLRPGGSVVLAANSPVGAAAHYLFGKWGDNGIGGLAYDGERRPPAWIGKYFAFSQHMELGAVQQYHYTPDDERVLYCSRWQQVLDGLGTGALRAAVLPYADASWFGEEDGGPPILKIGTKRYIERKKTN